MPKKGMAEGVADLFTDERIKQNGLGIEIVSGVTAAV